MKKLTPLTLENFEDLLDRKLDEKLDEKLRPIKNEIAQVKGEISEIKVEVLGIKGEISEIKDVTENRIYKELKDVKKKMEEGFAHLDDVTNAIVLDYNNHEDRIKHLEKRTGVTNNN